MNNVSMLYIIDAKLSSEKIVISKVKEDIELEGEKEKRMTQSKFAV